MQEPRGYIAREDLVVGKAYVCDARSFISFNGLSYAIWDGGQFNAMREKWGAKYMSQEHHYDDGAPYGTCKPLHQI